MISLQLAWVGFSVFVAVALALDLFVFHRRSHTIRLKEALLGAGGWVGLALLFNLALYLFRGPKPALEFLTGYVVELSLSVDNLFVFLMLFRYFQVPDAYRHRVLFWGILGAVVMRLAFIVAGVSMIHRFHWAIYIFGAILIWSGIRMAIQADIQVDPEKNPVLRLFRRYMPMTTDYRGDKFFVREGMKRLATPLFLVLWMINVTDLVFAVDSIPAVLAITTDTFVVFTSNVFAILGLRALFFSLAGAMDLFHRLHYGLSIILVFIGVKMVIADLFMIPTPIALGVVLGVLTISIIASLTHPRRTAPAPEPTGVPPTGAPSERPPANR